MTVFTRVTKEDDMERILIVDDETHVRQLLKEYLKSSGYQCELAANAAEARKQLDAKTFDLVITDIYMAGESGVDLAEYIKTVFIDTAIIIVSSMDDPDKIKKVLDIGVYGYIVKPIERNHVFINVENALQRLKLEKSERIYRNNLEQKIEERTAQAAENERRFRDLVEGSIQGIVVHLDKKAVFANKAFLDIFGYTEKELMQLDELHQIVAPEERGRLYDYQQARLAGKEAPSQYEFRGLCKDGTKIWVDNRVRVVDWHGKKAIQITVTDITQRKKSEISLKTSEANLKTILNSIMIGVLVIDEETNLIVDANPYATNLVGASKNQVVGAQYHTFEAPTKGEKTSITTVLENMNQSERELRLLNGDVIPILRTIKRAILDGRSCLIESFVDLRGRKKSEKLQKEQIHFLSEMVNDIPCPFYFKDKIGKYRIWNNAYEDFTGLKAEKVLGKTSYDIWPLEVARKIETQDNKLYMDPPTQKYNIQLPNRHGNIRDMEVTKSIYNNRDGNFGGLIGIMMDVTEKNQFEAQLHQAQKLESIGQLAAGIAHEINTPTQYVGDNTRFLKDAFEDLQTVLKTYFILLETVKPDVQYQALVEEIENTLEDADLEYLEEEIPVAIGQSLEGVERVTKIVRSMKEFSHPGVDEKTPVNLNNAIESTITVARNEWKYVADIETDFDPSIPPVSCFPGELNQVFLNLIVNAAHAMENGSTDSNNGKGIIHISTLSKNATAEIRISDTGCGIPPAIKHRIFDPFFTTKDVGKGTGQGLSIAHTVITENHNGTIFCESEEGKGTTFIIELPLTDSPSAEEAND